MTGRAPRPELSVVVPVYNEAGNIAPLFAEIREVMAALGRPFEILYVNDGSTDATLAELRGAAAAHPVLRILDLDGNFGEAAALCAGFAAARGDLVITLDGDGQNDPRDIPRLLEALERNGHQVVSGWRRERQEDLLIRVLPSRIANRLIAAVSRIPTHDNGCGLKVYRRAVVARAALPRGLNRFMPAIFGVRAAQVAEVAVGDRRRRHGQSHYGLSRTLAVVRDLLALRFIVWRPRLAEALWTVIGIGALLLAALLHAPWGRVVAVLVAGVSGLIWWNLRRYNRAQRSGVYRLRREYSSAEGA